MIAATQSVQLANITKGKDLAIYLASIQNSYFILIVPLVYSNSSIQKTIDKKVPSKLTQGMHTYPWINTRRRIGQKQRAHKKARKTKKKNTWTGTRDLNRKYNGKSDRLTINIWQKSAQIKKTTQMFVIYQEQMPRMDRSSTFEE